MGDFIDREKLTLHLPTIFQIGAVRSILPATGGLLCTNSVIEAERGKYFLKQYRWQSDAWIHGIKASEKHFSDNGIPVVLPVPDVDGRPVFWFEGNWYSLFPYIDGLIVTGAQLRDVHVVSIAKMLAKMHWVGGHFPKSSLSAMPVLPLWNRDRFLLEYAQVRRSLERITQPDEVDRLVERTLQRKKEIVLANTRTPDQFPFSSVMLLQGDFQSTNFFFDEAGNISRTFDYESTCIGPRAFEVVRSLLISCFEPDFKAENFRLGRLFLDTYRQDHPLDFDEFRLGVEAYLLDMIHKLWIEIRRYLTGTDRFDFIYRIQADRIEALNGRTEEFCREVFPG